MSYCFHCGHGLVFRVPDGDSQTRMVCIECQRVQYENPKIIVSCLAYWQDQIVLCRRGQPPAFGLWNPPMGFLEMGESLEEGAAREMLEEVGLMIQPSELKLYSLFSIPHISQVYVNFRASLARKPVLKPGPEVLEARMYSEKNMPNEIAFGDVIKDMPKVFFECLKNDSFPIHSIILKPTEPSESS